MKKTKLLLSALVLILGLPLLFSAPPKTVTIIVKEAKVYSKASYFGKVAATLKYEDKVSVLQEKGRWYKVSLSGGKQGWINATAVTKGEFTTKTSSKDTKTGATSEEVSLAGKGYTKEVENEYKKQKKIDFSWVDKMETFGVSGPEKESFLSKGGLKTEEGGAQ